MSQCFGDIGIGFLVHTLPQKQGLSENIQKQKAKNRIEKEQKYSKRTNLAQRFFTWQIGRDSVHCNRYSRSLWRRSKRPTKADCVQLLVNSRPPGDTGGYHRRLLSGAPHQRPQPGRRFAYGRKEKEKPFFPSFLPNDLRLLGNAEFTPMLLNVNSSNNFNNFKLTALANGKSQSNKLGRAGKLAKSAKFLSLPPPHFSFPEKREKRLKVADGHLGHLGHRGGRRKQKEMALKAWKCARRR